MILPLQYVALKMLGGVSLVVLFAFSGCRKAEATRVENNTESTEERPDRFEVNQAEVELLRHMLLKQPDGEEVYFWWDGVPRSIREQRLPPPVSNIRHEDYAGPASCKKCHEEQYDNWSKHPHRHMNALATEESVIGDFSGDAGINYLGGRGSFYREDGQFRMRLVRDGQERTYEIRRTLGSRFFQYYIGRLLSGPDPAQHGIWSEDHVLPFGYWIDHKMWVPIVHVGHQKEPPDAQRHDPFAVSQHAPYDKMCSACHTTLPAGDRMLSNAGIADHIPRALSIFAAAHLSEEHPDLVDPKTVPKLVSGQKVHDILITGNNGLLSQKNTVALGITCEACHHGSKEHVENKWNLPRFFPSGENIFTIGKNEEEVWGRTAENLNWTCAQCHVGERPVYAGGMHTWNSTEYTDAANGHCYSVPDSRKHSMKQLTCVECHDPHKPTGSQWKSTIKQDDANCVKCHQQYRESGPRLAHTHHAEGVGCMDCHMPRINEGLQDMVRTHRIFKPSEPTMVESNQPNACNLCHLDKSIDWTIGHLGDWYDGTPSYSEVALARSYPKRDGPVGLGWLASEHEATRLAGASALLRSEATWALPDLIEILDDPYLINRQFTQRGLERMLDVKLEDYGYRFYMAPEERSGPIERLRERLLESREDTDGQEK